MKLSTGKVAFPIEFDNGDKAVIYFNPNDRKIYDRIRRVEEEVEEKIKQIDLEKHKAAFDGEINIDLENPEKLFDMTDEEISALDDRLSAIVEIEEQYNQIVMDELDSIFESKISDVVFRYCKPFDPVVVDDGNGGVKRELFMMQFLSWLAVELKKHGAENKSAMEKHLAKYSK